MMGGGMTPAPRSGRAPPHLRFGAHLHWRCAPAQCQRVCRAHTVSVSLREPDGADGLRPGQVWVAWEASAPWVVAGLLGLGLQLGLLVLVVVGIVWAVRSMGGSWRATSAGASGPLPKVGAALVQRVCPNCGQPARPEWHHCPHCGAPLA